MHLLIPKVLSEGQRAVLYIMFEYLYNGKTTAAKQDNSNVSNYSLFIKEHI